MSHWVPLLVRYNEFSQAFNLAPSPPATTKDIQALDDASKPLHLKLDPALYEFLRISNGTSFDSVRFYGANINDRDGEGRFDFATVNELVEERGKDTLYGEWQDEFFVGVRSMGTFERRSKVTGDPYSTFNSYGDLVQSVLEEACGFLEARVRQLGNST